jgi:hypothetical protein
MQVPRGGFESTGGLKGKPFATIHGPLINYFRCRRFRLSPVNYFALALPLCVFERDYLART